MRRESDERRAGADWRGDRNRADRDVDGGERGNLCSTYGWHPRSVAAAIATLRDLKANRPRLLAGVGEMSEYFRVRLLQLEFDRPAAVRIQGLAIGIDVGDEDYADTIHDQCRRNGLLVSTEGSTVLLLPSLAIDKRTAARGLDILGALDPTRRGGVAPNPRVQPAVARVLGDLPTHVAVTGTRESSIVNQGIAAQTTDSSGKIRWLVFGTISATGSSVRRDLSAAMAHDPVGGLRVAGSRSASPNSPRRSQILRGAATGCLSPDESQWQRQPEIGDFQDRHAVRHRQRAGS